MKLIATSSTFHSTLLDKQIYAQKLHNWLDWAKYAFRLSNLTLLSNFLFIAWNLCFHPNSIPLKHLTTWFYWQFCANIRTCGEHLKNHTPCFSRHIAKLSSNSNSVGGWVSINFNFNTPPPTTHPSAIKVKTKSPILRPKLKYQALSCQLDLTAQIFSQSANLTQYMVLSACLSIPVSFLVVGRCRS